ncbi:amidase [Rhodococcus rhodochrous]|uniref:amidase n=1 Tax=Rhodococcus rhodochrous TaxID=1829 RepID=UPI001CE27016|nr:amidase [Rhodococcus rhodochrous]
MDRRRGSHRGTARRERILSGTTRRAAAISGGPTAHVLDETLGSVITWIDTPDATIDGPLTGMRIGVKDNIDVTGVPTTCASRFFSDRIASAHAEVVRRLIAAGAQITAKLNMAEFAVGVTSQNSAVGPVRNPWDPSRVPGGSSGGSGAAVAAGLVDAALGTDTGGSVRLPAAACGITGLRPTWGAISNTGVFPVSDAFDTVGPMARSVTEVARLFDVLRTDQAPAPSPARRIGLPSVFITDDVDAAISDAIDAAARQLQSVGYEVVPVDVPGAAHAQDIVYILLYSDLAALHHDRVHSSPDLFHPDTLARVSLGLSISDSERTAALAARAEFRRGLSALFTDVDAVLTPTMPVDVPPIAGDDDVIARSRRLGQFSYPWSLHDGPTLALPVGSHPHTGMPIGAQLTAAAHHESLLFGIGEEFQRTTDWHTRRPPLYIMR